MKSLKLLAVLSILLAGGLSFAQDTPPTSQPAASPAAAAQPSSQAPETATTASKADAPTPAPTTGATAPAASQEVSGDTQKWWQGLLVTVIEGVAAIAFPILSLLLMALAHKWKLKIEQEKIDWVLSKAIGFGEQKAKVALKDGKPMSGPEIAKIAVEHGSKLLDQYKLPKKLGDYLADLIEAKLGEKVVSDGGAKASVTKTAEA